jgi:mannose-6-phosphate isomerase-like protein (cupin superfamily)
MDYTDIVVKKPWGKEYLCYRNSEVAIWYLHIEKDKETSMHCHPKKNTGFVVLEGKAKLSFLRNSVDLEGLDKIHIFRSRFHSTKAITDSFIFEIETPEDKHDLVRLEDAYGRAGTEYEGKSFHTPKDDSCFWINEAPTPIIQEINDCYVTHIEIVDKEQILGGKEDEIFVVTNGGIVTDKQQKVLWPGDVIDGETLARLARAFEIDAGTTMIHIMKAF